MTLLHLLADGEPMPALPWPYVLALCVALGGAIVALWKRDIDRENARSAREKEMTTETVAQARGDGQETTKALAAAADRMAGLAKTIDDSTRDRAAIGKEILEAISELRPR
jgi:hypothetical protein